MKNKKISKILIIGFLLIFLVSIILISGCILRKPIGGETDEHGCLSSAGYTWCESKQKCLRTWEEPCDDYNFETCNSKCLERGYDVGHCMWPDEICDDDVEIGTCLVPYSNHCGEEGQCNCYCKNESPVEGEVGSKDCINDDDCVVFGKTGDCNCGCYNKNNLPVGTGGACYCAAPTSCKCVNNKCEGIFNCAQEGVGFSSVYEDFSEHCCEGLTEWLSGMDTRISIADECYETGLLAGSPIGICINCGNGICRDIENPCNCPEDCKGKDKSDFMSIEEFCQSEYWNQTFSEACEEIIKGFPICELC